MVFFVTLNVLLLGLVHVAVGTPCLSSVCGSVGGITESFSESAKSVSTAASSSSYEASSRSFSSASGSSCSSFDSSYWSSLFEKCSCFSNIECECYLKWLSTFSGSSLEYFTSIADYLTIQEALKSDIVDYTLLQTDIASAYEFFNSKGIYSVDFDLVSQTSIFEEYAKSKLSNTLKCLAPGSPLHNLLKYSVESDCVSLPCTIGFLNAIVQSQKSYFSSTSSTSTRSIESSTTSSSVSSTSGNKGCSSVDVSQYLDILTKAKIKEAECQVYVDYLGRLGSDKVCLFTDLINYLNQGNQVLTTEMILDFANLNSEIHSLYEMLVKEQFFVANADWLAKEAVLTELKSKLSTALSYMSSNCGLYSALQYCLEKDLCYLPMYIGLCEHLFEQQSSYFSVSTSSSTTVSSSSSSSSCSSICR